MKRLYQLITEPQFTRCTKPSKYKKLLFALCFFHSILLERKKFLQLGWNVVYGFNDSDFEVPWRRTWGGWEKPQGREPAEKRPAPAGGYEPSMVLL